MKESKTGGEGRAQGEGADALIVSFGFYSKWLNYGAALHPFVFLRYLEGIGAKAAILDYESKSMEGINLKRLPLFFIKKGRTLRSVVAAILCAPSYRRKYKKFRAFYDANCKMLRKADGAPFTYADFNRGAQEIKFGARVAVCEGDVSWSPVTSAGFDRVFFFDYPCFAPLKKVAYAPSISNTILTKEQEAEFKRLAANYDFLSAREGQTAAYVSELTGRPCPHVLDAVLLVDGAFYEPYMERQCFRNYLLAYNVMVNDKKMLEAGKKVASERNMRFIELSDYAANKRLHKALTGRSIGEFLWLLKNAGFVVTNGFHGMCFSILFKREFLVFERDGVDIKTRDLLSALKLEERFVPKSEAGYIVNPAALAPINWGEVYERLDALRASSRQYIERALACALEGAKPAERAATTGGGY